MFIFATAKHYIYNIIQYLYYSNMKKFFTSVMALLFGCGFVVAQNFGGEQTTNGDINAFKSQKDVNYVGDGKGYHNLDIYFPKEDGKKHPVLIHIYGSAWQSNDGKGGADLGSVGYAACSNGYIFVAPNHRSSSDAQWPSQSHDIKAVIRYIRGNAEKLGVDTSFIAISGFSSGGHLASVMGTSRNVKVGKYGSAQMDLEGNLGAYTSFSSSVDAVVDWSGPVNLLRMDCYKDMGGMATMQMPQMEENLMGCTKSACNDKFHLLNANTYIDPSDPPFMICHGSSDNIVAQCQGIEFEEELRKAGVYTELYKHSGGHGVASQHCGDMIKFLAKAREMKGAVNPGTGDVDPGTNPGNKDKDEKAKFHIYFAFGQSNTWGNADPTSSDKNQNNPRIKMMSTSNGRGNVGTWMNAKSPLVAMGAGYSYVDNFLRVMAENLPEDETIGVIPVAIPGASIKCFDPDQYQKEIASSADWLQNIAKDFDGNPYKRMIDCGKKAIETGTIEGFVFHQGESDWGYSDWAKVVTKIHNGICSELNLDKDNVAFVLGELLNEGARDRMDQVAGMIKKCKVVSTKGLSGVDDYHFTYDSYTELGRRYAEAMLELVGGGSVQPKEATPYGGIAAKIPGKIEAENYDEGGSNVGWYDKSSGNSCDSYTNVYRSDDVDIKKDGSDYVVGNCQSGEWMQYTVDVEADGEYELTVRVGEGGTNGKFTLTMDDKSIDYTVNVANTGEWGTYAEQKQSKKFNLKKGTHVLKLSIDADWVDIDWLEFTSLSTSCSSVNAKRVSIVPNPASAKANVVAEGDVECVEILNMVGEVVKVCDNRNIDTSSLGNGLYLVRTVVDGESTVHKLVVNK